jgi:hypothetical protein
MSSGKAPSEGTKVTKGAPYTSEATGPVPSDSLAAESKAFTQSNEAQPQDYPKESLTSSSTPREAPSSGSTSGGPKSVGTAPTYVNNLYHRNESGPHGKNIKEDNSIGTEDQAKNASFSEFGTNEDPARLAEKKFTLADSAAASSTGARQQTLDKSTPYDALGSEREA